MFKNPLSVHEIEDLLGPRPLSDLLSTRTTEYRARGLDKGTHGDSEILRHMELEPRLIRRPILAYDGELLVGFDAARWEEALLRRK